MSGTTTDESTAGGRPALTGEATAPEGPTAVLAVDTGGTFTDLVLLRDGRVRTLKVPSTPDDPARAILEGAGRLLAPGESFTLLHGSTVATNALLERKGARVVLVTNQGFEDVLEIGRQNRPQLYALVGHRPPPLVPRVDRIGIAGRLEPDGRELAPLDPAELEGLPARVRDAGAVAVTLLHSYADPTHEEAVAEALTDALGADGIPLSVSSRILPEYREYERTSTTVVNAYVAPVMSRYLGRLARESGAGRVAVMGSGGGMLSVDRAVREPVHTVLSGPAGGVVGALAWARRAGAEHIVTFDMGGTSTDVSLCPGRALHTREFHIDGHPVAVPVIDIHTVGAGGGSLARVDAGGALRVGPESAGADPGPVAYGRGGTGVTVTDAHVWLGRLPEEGFLGGEGGIGRERVREPLARLGAALGATPEAAAEGVLAVADTAMEGALRVISVERGFDPAALALVAFGGAGGLHAAGLAGRLGVREALIPPDPGLLSAWGILAAPPTRERSRTVLLPASDPDTAATLDPVFRELVREAMDGLAEEGAARDSLVVERWVDVRYRGQSFELRVPAAGWVEAFHTAHEARYGYARRDAEVEAVTVRAAATAPALDVPAPELPPAEGPPPATAGTVLLGGAPTPCPRLWRRDLRPGHRVAGPALVLDYSATTWVPPEWTLDVHPSGVLRLRASREPVPGPVAAE
ncbi:MAG: hydantoinase/oxoprolinase family protein [Longimicrobiales bacterium]|nr:hydantoinase/oxoprolinase family protein [Longimicrobiales bacterium]